MRELNGENLLKVWSISTFPRYKLFYIQQKHNPHQICNRINLQKYNIKKK
jgi:hypothetical protein